MTRVEDPTDQVEQELFATGARRVAGIDEVGRGAWAGPVSVGIAVVDREALERLPKGVRDSKMLSPKRRAELFPMIAEALCEYSVGHASPQECDALGMTAAQRLATNRAIASLSKGFDAVVLDGTVNFTDVATARLIAGADRRVFAVASASILAKVTRDRLMSDFHAQFPDYGFARNKGYPAPEHTGALDRLGLTSIHRKSWSFASRYAS